MLSTFSKGLRKSKSGGSLRLRFLQDGLHTFCDCLPELMMRSGFHTLSEAKPLGLHRLVKRIEPHHFSDFLRVEDRYLVFFVKLQEGDSISGLEISVFCFKEPSTAQFVRRWWFFSGKKASEFDQS